MDVRDSRIDAVVIPGGIYMKEFTNITIEKSKDGILIIQNPTKYPLVGQGKHGAILRLDTEVCVKIYADPSEAEVEGNVYKQINGSPIIPQIYEVGRNYIVMEYIDGPNLRDYLVREGSISSDVTTKILALFYEMKRLGFTRMDEALRHILVTKEITLKIIDNYYAFMIWSPYPIKLFKGLEEISLLKSFLTKVSKLDRSLYEYWKEGIPGYFER